MTVEANNMRVKKKESLGQIYGRVMNICMQIGSAFKLWISRLYDTEKCTLALHFGVLNFAKMLFETNGHVVLRSIVA